MYTGSLDPGLSKIKETRWKSLWNFCFGNFGHKTILVREKALFEFRFTKNNPWTKTITWPLPQTRLPLESLWAEISLFSPTETSPNDVELVFDFTLFIRGHPDPHSECDVKSSALGWGMKLVWDNLDKLSSCRERVRWINSHWIIQNEEGEGKDGLSSFPLQLLPSQQKWHRRKKSFESRFE